MRTCYRNRSKAILHLSGKPISSAINKHSLSKVRSRVRDDIRDVLAIDRVAPMMSLPVPVTLVDITGDKPEFFDIDLSRKDEI